MTPEFIAALTPAERLRLPRRWSFWARDGQCAPKGDWRLWLVCAGRGFGKTRAGAEWVLETARRDPHARIALVAASLAEARAVMVEGESGILACASRKSRPLFEPSLRRLSWRNGAMATLYSAAEPESLRGPQHSHALRGKATRRPARRTKAKPGSSAAARAARGPITPARSPASPSTTGPSSNRATGCGCSTIRPGNCCSAATAHGPPRPHRPHPPAEPWSMPKPAQLSAH